LGYLGERISRQSSTQWIRPSPDDISSTGLNERQWLSLKKCVLPSSLTHPLLIPMISFLLDDDTKKDAVMVWCPTINKMIKYRFSSKYAANDWHNNYCRSHLLDQPSPVIDDTNTCEDREILDHRYTVGGRLAYAIGCSEEQFVYMCTKANDQLMISLLNRIVLKCNIIDNGSAVVIKYYLGDMGPDWGER
jgi:hypothetical protein